MKQKIIGEGMDSNSDLIIEFDIEFPNKLSDQRKTYLKKLLPINNTIINKTKTNTSNYKDNIRDINSSSSQAPSDKGSDDDITFDTMTYAQQVSDECERNEREYQEIMKDIEKNKEKE